jgi:hypothetical protein
MSADFLSELRSAFAGLPYVPRYELYCDTSVYYALQRIGDLQPMYSPHPLDAIYGASIVVVPELGQGVWELYGDGKLMKYGRIRG